MMEFLGGCSAAAAAVVAFVGLVVAFLAVVVAFAVVTILRYDVVTVNLNLYLLRHDDNRFCVFPSVESKSPLFHWYERLV